MASATPTTFAAVHLAHILAGRSAGPSLSGDVIVTGDSLTDMSYNIYPAGWGLARTMFPPRVIHNDGIQAQTMQQIVDRLQATITLYPSANTYLLRMGTNGPGSGTYQDQFNRARDILAANGKFGVFFAIPPHLLGTAGVDSSLIAVNTALKTMCDASPSTLLYVADGMDLGDANYNANPAYYAESSTPTHMNVKGSYLMAERIATALATLFVHTDPRLTDSADKYPSTSQYVQNGLMAGTSGTKDGVVTGTVPTGWFAQAFTTADYTVSIFTDAEGTWLRTAINNCSAGNMAIRTTLSHPAFAADMSAIKRLDLVMEVRTVNLDPAVIPSAQFILDSANQLKGSGVTITTPPTGLMNKQAVMRMAFPRDRGPSATTITPEAFAANTLNVGLWINLLASTTSGGSIDIRCVSVRGSAT